MVGEAHAPQVIPAEAVEAAHEQLEAMGAYVSRDYVEAALEAAAPHMLAAVWDQGYKTAMFDKEYYSHNPNPYRTPNAR